MIKWVVIASHYRRSECGRFCIKEVKRGGVSEFRLRYFGNAKTYSIGDFSDIVEAEKHAETFSAQQLEYLNKE